MKVEEINQSIKYYSNWIVNCFATENLDLNFSTDSLKHLDKFIDDHSINGEPKPNGILNKNHEEILFGMGIYLGETIKKYLPGSKWLISEEENNSLTGDLILPNDAHVFPIEKIFKRFQNGSEDEIYAYGLIVIEQMSKDDFWESSSSENEKNKKKWWKFW